MVNINKEQKEIAVNQAWDHLFQRLNKDGLLPDEASGRPQHRSMPLTRMPSVSGKPQSRSVHTTVNLSIAATVAVCIMIGWFALRKTNPQDGTMLVLYNESHAPTLATMLEDGSIVYLSAQTSLTYPERFAEEKREVTLQGEAFFEINSQPERPFHIDTDLADVEVTGTSFKLKCDHGASFLLSVREGEVLVTQKSNHQTLTVKAGETALFDSNHIRLKKNTTGFDEFFTRIHFKDERLADMAAIINLHLDTHQLKVDPAVENRIITFTFVVNSHITETAELICQAMDLHLTQQDNLLYISNPE